MPSYYLGFDGGQSSSTAVIADDHGHVLGEGHGGPCNHVAASEGRERFFTAVSGCLTEAVKQAGLDPATLRFAAACFGFSGGAADKDTYVRELVDAEHYKITHDAEIALTGATAGQPGIIVIAGTGSMAFGRNRLGKTARAGGWGYVFGDEGGSFDLTRRAVQAALRHEEQWGPPTQLREGLLAATESKDMNSLLHRFYTPEFSRSKIASFAPLVTKAAESGDDVALEIIVAAAIDLACFAEGVHRRLFPQKQEVPVAHVGGGFNSTPLREAFVAAIRERIGCTAVAPLHPPVVGALIEALRADGKFAAIASLTEA
ncbi:MAG TPA: BadF/BadG/BcrA/BcrD ATPase family protein [Bryobacteraceae bacterium]|jgi:N-acetylglucosamine kinase-like BadF-type ATPase|nr:BadF/BadG/BcrA/BcrD ATPase family protein [Bryobacteraceae bacterium]